MSRRRSTVLSLGAAAALVLPMGAAASATTATTTGADSTPEDHWAQAQATDQPTELHDEIATALARAGEQRHAGAGVRSDASDALDEATRTLVEDGAVGVTARVHTPGLDWRGAAGASEVDGRPPASPHDRFRVASITKAMVATVVMQEVEAGTFALDTPVEEIVPGLFPDHPEVTVEHLLTHRSGAQTGTELSVAARMEDPNSLTEFLDALTQDYTDEEHLAHVNAAEWLFEPGTDFGYSNAGYIALGVILEEVTGQELADLLEERVFAPAGMRHTSFPDDADTRGPFLVDAAHTGAEEEGGLGWVSLAEFDPDVFSAAGAATSTTRDLNSFTEALISGDLVDPALVEDMIVPRSDTVMEYGLGVYRLPDPCTPEGEPTQWLYGHDGGSYGTISMALTSADGSRQLSFGVNGRYLASEPEYDIAELLVPMVLATCEQS